MNKMTHVKFNLNNFLFTLSDLIDNSNQAKHFSSKRVAYIALKIAKLNMLQSDMISDLLSYCCIHNSSYLLSQMDKIPFNNYENINHPDFKAIFEIALFVEKKFSVTSNYVPNKETIIHALEKEMQLDEIFKENLLYLMEFDYFWLDLSNKVGLPFKILDMIDDFTIEYAYDDLIQLSQLFYQLYYIHTSRINKTDIAQRLKTVATFYNFDEKDTARLIISGYLSYIGYLNIQKDVCLNEAFFESSNIHDSTKLLQIHANAYFTKEYLSMIFGFDDISELASSFAENIDGSGYPFKKEGSELSLKARLFTIIYRLQALEEQRNYRKEYSVEEIEKILYQEAENGFIDKSILREVLSLMHT